MIILFLSLIFSKYFEDKQFLPRLTLLSPHVGENGMNDYFEFGGDYVQMTRTRNENTQLSFAAPNSNGYLKTKDPIKIKNFSISINFSLLPQGYGSSYRFAFINKEDINSADTLGVSLEWKNGASLKVTGVPKSKTFSPSLANKECRLVFKCLGGQTEITLLCAGNTTVLYNGRSTISPDWHFGIFSSSGNSSSVLRIHSIEGYSVKRINAPYVVGETKKSNRLIIFLGVCAIVGLMAYLYKKQQKDFSLEN